MSLSEVVQTNKSAAIAYAEHGLPVVGMWWCVDGQCACGAQDCSGKHPFGGLFSKGFHSASADANVIALLWDTSPSMDVAISLWMAGLVALECDNDEQLQQIRRWEKQYGSLPTTWQSISGGKKLPAWWFRSPWPVGAPLRKSSIILPGGELKRDCLTVGPSIHRSGGRYEWADGRSPFDTDIAQLPDWLRQLAEDANGRRNGSTSSGSNGETWVVKDAVDGCLEDHAGVSEFRHNTLSVPTFLPLLLLT